MNEIATCALVSYGVSIFRSDPLWDRKHRCPDEKSIQHRADTQSFVNIRKSGVGNRPMSIVAS